jgi:hypothetical protein
MPLRRHGTFLFAVLLATPLSVCRLHAQTLADYAIVDRIEDDWVNRNPVPVRPMAIHSDGSVWAVNSYLGTLCKIVGTTVTTFRTLPGPVSVALHPEVSKAYVACQHANAVAVHSLTTGDILDVVFVRAQPQDVLLTAGPTVGVVCRSRRGGVHRHGQPQWCPGDLCRPRQVADFLDLGTW